MAAFVLCVPFVRGWRAESVEQRLLTGLDGIDEIVAATQHQHWYSDYGGNRNGRVLARYHEAYGREKEPGL